MKHTQGPWTTSSVDKRIILSCGTGAAKVAAAFPKLATISGSLYFSRSGTKAFPKLTNIGGYLDCSGKRQSRQTSV